MTEQEGRVLLQIILLFLLFFAIYFVFRLFRLAKLEKRISKYTIGSASQTSLSILDQLDLTLSKIRHVFANGLSKLKIFNAYAKWYQDRGIGVSKKIPSMDLIATKFFTGGLLFVLSVVGAILSEQHLLFVSCFGFFLGFFLPDLFYFLERSSRSERVERDFPKAMTVLEHAFRSGKSIYQAVGLVATDLDGPVGEEFRLISLDLEYGLSLEESLQRFAKRVSSPDVQYLTTSLTVLNQTGGEIERVFTVIQKNLSERRNLKEETKSVTASAQFLSRFLSVIPILLAGALYLLNPSYFTVLVTTSLGFQFLVVLLFLYFLYLFLVARIMKVEEL